MTACLKFKIVMILKLQYKNIVGPVGGLNIYNMAPDQLILFFFRNFWKIKMAALLISICINVEYICINLTE